MLHEMLPWSLVWGWTLICCQHCNHSRSAINQVIKMYIIIYCTTRSKNRNSKRTSNAGLTETSNSIQTNTSTSVVSAPPPPPVQPAAPPPPPVVGFSPTSNGGDSARNIPSTEGRGALLSDIRKGMSLRKATTNDRSNPRVWHNCIFILNFKWILFWEYFQ